MPYQLSGPLVGFFFAVTPSELASRRVSAGRMADTFGEIMVEHRVGGPVEIQDVLRAAAIRRIV